MPSCLERFAAAGRGRAQARRQEGFVLVDIDPCSPCSMPCNLLHTAEYSIDARTTRHRNARRAGERSQSPSTRSSIPMSNIRCCDHSLRAALCEVLRWASPLGPLCFAVACGYASTLCQLRYWFAIPTTPGKGGRFNLPLRIITPGSSQRVPLMLPEHLTLTQLLSPRPRIQPEYRNNTRLPMQHAPLLQLRGISSGRSKCFCECGSG